MDVKVFAPEDKFLIPPTEDFGGAHKRSQYCSNASRNDRETSGDDVVVQSTRYG